MAELQASHYSVEPVQQENNEPDISVKRSFKEDLNQKYSGSEFDYTKTKPHTSLWEKFKQAIGKIIRRVFNLSDRAEINRITKIFLYILGGVIMVVLIYNILKLISGRQGNFFFSKKNKKLEIQEEDIIENIHEINFHELITQYELQKNYRSAFRYQFLEILKKLADKGEIEWIPEKTNVDYLNEMQSTQKAKLFERAVYIFDHIWYGDFKISEEEYHAFTNEINPLKTNYNE